MNTPKHVCPYCSGSGKVSLAPVYAETLQGVSRMCASSGFVVANLHARWFGCSPTALNNRLKRLEELGYLSSEMHGRQRRYTVK